MDHCVYGRPPGMLPPASKNVATGGPFGSNGKRSVCGSSVTPPRPPPNAAPVSPPATAPRPAPAAGAAGAAGAAAARAASRGGRAAASAAPASAASLVRRSAVGAHPHAGEVDLAVGRPRRRGILAHVALCVPRDARVWNLAPLRRDGHGTGHHHANHAVNCLHLFNPSESPWRAPNGYGAPRWIVIQSPVCVSDWRER